MILEVAYLSNNHVIYFSYKLKFSVTKTSEGQIS